MNKRLWIVFGVVIVAIVTLVIIAVNGQTDEDKLNAEDVNWHEVITKDTLPEGTSESDIEIAKDINYGNTESKVTFIQWMNFQCSACQSLYHTLDDIYQEYKDEVAFVDRYIYLTNHPNGLATSVAAEAAAKQGKFYEMHSQLMSNAEAWNNASIDTRESIFRGFAEEIGLDLDKWTEDYKNYEKNGIKERLDFQNQLAIAAGVTASPHIMVNGEKVANKAEDIKKALDKALEKN